MTIQEKIEAYIKSQPEAKRSDLQTLHQHILKTLPKCKLWFLDGKDSTGKIVSNPNIGYGSYNIHYADGTSKVFYQIGLSANTSGISVYILGIKDKNYLFKTFGEKLGKATVTGYCIRFKKLKDIDLDILADAIRFGIETTNERINQ